MKKIILILAFCLTIIPSFADEYENARYEHLFEEKNAPNNQAIITENSNVICKGNVIKAAFECKFKSECHHAGDDIDFIIQDAIYTKEGTLLIPKNSKLYATIVKIKKQRMPNKNARVYFHFNSLETPDGCVYEISAMPNTKDNSLKEGPWMTAGKLTLSTLGLGVIGAGAGTGFAFIPNPAKLGVGFAIGIPVGCGVGLIAGLITPGLKYHAKAGEEIYIVLCDNLMLDKQCEECYE